MPGFGSITDLNAVITLTVPGPFPIPIQLEGFSVDDIYDVGDRERAEYKVGADGFGAAGKIYNLVEQTFSFLASSPSCFLFEAWTAFEDAQNELSPCTGTVTLPSQKRSYIQQRGILVRDSPMGSLGKTAKDRKWVIKWLTVAAIPI